jgi:hypothetical protein
VEQPLHRRREDHEGETVKKSFLIGEETRAFVGFDSLLAEKHEEIFLHVFRFMTFTPSR